MSLLRKWMIFSLLAYSQDASYNRICQSQDLETQCMSLIGGAGTTQVMGDKFAASQVCII